MLRIDGMRELNMLFSETSGIRKLKSLNGEKPKRNSQAGVDGMNVDDFDSETDGSEEMVPEVGKTCCDFDPQKEEFAIGTI